MTNSKQSHFRNSEMLIGSLLACTTLIEKKTKLLANIHCGLWTDHWHIFHALIINNALLQYFN